MADKPKQPTKPSRRKFLATGTTAAGAVTLGTFASPALGFHASVDDTLKVGLIGCGGRGTGAVQDILEADSRAKVTALADAFIDRVNITKDILQTDVADKYAVAEENIFTGISCHEEIVKTDIDVVLLATPPHFRPAQMEAAVRAGKHVFCEKPVAVDVPGAKRVLAACEEAESKGLSVVSGLCWRYDTAVNEVIDRVLGGDIGEIVSIESNYLTGTLWHRIPKPDQVWSPLEQQLRNWLYYNWLSGDHITEQHIHSIDKVAWLYGDTPPESCYGVGGRLARTEKKWGNVYDHFTTVYQWADGRKAFCHCRQMDHCFNQTDDFAYGTEGVAGILSRKIENGAGTWSTKRTSNRMYVNEHIKLTQSIRGDGPINNGHYMVNSTLMALFGRDAAYSGKKLEWDQFMQSEVVLGPESWADQDYVPDPVAIPGR